MNRRHNLYNLLAVCAAFVISLGTPLSLLARDRTFVPVAAYLNQPDVTEKVGKRVAAILDAHKITNGLGHRIFGEAAWAKWTNLNGSDSAVIFVPKDESTEARLVLARAIKAEGLRITLKDDNAATISPETILEPSKNP